MKAAEIEEIFKRFEKNQPEPKGELDYTNTYTLLVAVALSAQATDVTVNKATKALFEKVKTPQDMLKLGEEKLKDHIKTIGLYNTKAKNVIKAAEILVNEHGGKVPGDLAALVKLPGVGRKTANIVLNVAFGENRIGVDTHIFRVSNRTGMAPGKTTDAVEKKLMNVIPEKYQKHAHLWLVLHGRYICTARKPKCSDCLINDLCEYDDKNFD